ncbi:DUF397 domain-containing protein [Streptomyces sp. DT24]|uniref:DUF397 domain-containing protein n=1 Tax=unclassified Streptomyces TaxID=2593676 RepID=UPI003CF4D2FA
MQHKSVEPGWRASSYSSGNGQCLEVRDGVTGAMPVRDSKDTQGPVLTFNSSAWLSFLGTVKGDAFPLAG